MRNVRLVALAALLTLALIGSAQAASTGKTVIRLAHRWAETNHWTAAFQNVERAFEEKYPDIDVQVEAGWGGR